MGKGEAAHYAPYGRLFVLVSSHFLLARDNDTRIIIIAAFVIGELIIVICNRVFGRRERTTQL